MGYEEYESLTESKITRTKLYLKLRRWPYKPILICILIVCAVYLLYSFIDSNIKLDSTKIIKTTKINLLHISSVATTNGDYLKQCAPKVNCDPNAKYRSINGSCNNLEIPTWGASETPFLRLLDANFSDGYYALRVQTDGSMLPNARELNVRLFLSRETYHGDENNVLLVPFGQLVAHDISGLPTDVPINEQGLSVDCCHDAYARNTFSQCQLNLDNPSDDPVYSRHNISCMGLVRVVTSRNYSCPLYPTTFINVNTHFIDASEVYGSNISVANHLRAMEGGRLNFSIADEGQMFCPFMAKKKKIPNEQKDVRFKYDTGDPDNGNQNLGITTMQTLFLRFHNYIAFKLSLLNPLWTDEILYQESRRIVIGTIQRILYQDFLPVIIGEDFQYLYGINEENIYDPTVNPSMSQELSSAAFRVLHNLIPVKFNFMNENYTTELSINITDWLLKSDLLPVHNNFDKVLRGFIETPGRVAQPSYNFFVSNYMFSVPGEPAYTGLDLMAADITRGRDVGLQTYNQVRSLCGLPLATDFENLTDLIRPKDVHLLKELHHSVNDIDLLVGLMLEKRSDGALVGPTTRCLLADGFYRYKVGDRFFYDVRGQPGSFTPDQLKIIKKVTLGHVICAVSNVRHVQKDMFKIVDHNLFPTSKLVCDDDFYLDLNAWEELNDR